MQVTHQRPDRRRHHRVKAPLSIDIYGRSYPAVDWSLGGFRIGQYEAGGNRKGENLDVGAKISCRLTIPFQGFGVSFEAEAQIVRRDDDRKELAAKFVHLNERAVGILSHFIDQIVRGYMTPIEDTIQRIDVPVTPVSIKPDTAPVESKPPLRRLPTKTICMVTFYTIAGLLLFSYLSASIYTTIFELEVDSGVVTAPVEPIVGTVDGRIARLETPLNHLVEAGTPLVIFEDARLEQEIDLAQIAVMRATSAYESAEDALLNERSKTEDLGDYASGEVERARARVRSLKERKATAYAQMNRQKKLLDKGYTSRSHYDDAYSKYIRLKGELEEAQSHLKDRKAVAQKVESGRYFNGLRFEGDLPELESALKKAERDVVLAVRELDAHLDRRERLIVRAPSTGRVVTMMKKEGSSVKRGEPIALFEREEGRVIDVFMTQEDLLEVRLGDRVEVYFPATGEKVLDRSIDDRPYQRLHR